MLWISSLGSYSRAGIMQNMEQNKKSVLSLFIIGLIIVLAVILIVVYITIGNNLEVAQGVVLEKATDGFKIEGVLLNKKGDKIGTKNYQYWVKVNEQTEFFASTNSQEPQDIQKISLKDLPQGEMVLIKAQSNLNEEDGSFLAEKIEVFFDNHLVGWVEEIKDDEIVLNSQLAGFSSKLYTVKIDSQTQFKTVKYEKSGNLAKISSAVFLDIKKGDSLEITTKEAVYDNLAEVKATEVKIIKLSLYEK